jgi:hypothetical protein
MCTHNKGQESNVKDKCRVERGGWREWENGDDDKRTCGQQARTTVDCDEHAIVLKEFLTGIKVPAVVVVEKEDGGRKAKEGR